MTNEELNRRVGELCGWKPYTGFQTIAYMWAPGHVSNVVPNWTRTRNDEVDFLIDHLDYCRDLNAVHEIEATLNPSDLLGESPVWDKYVRHLRDTAGRTHGFHATARQRCLAFVLTMEQAHEHEF